MTGANRRNFLVAMTAPLGGIALAQHHADLPPIRVLVGFPPGGAADALGRLAAASLSERLGRSLYVENKAGAAGTLAASLTAQSHDGRTLLFGSPTALTIAPAIGQVSLKYSPTESFDPVGMVCSYPLILIVRRELGVTSLRQLITELRTGTLKLNIGSFGIASTAGLATELLRSKLGESILHVPFGGGAAAVQALLAGTVDAVFDTPITALPMIQAGRVVPIAVTSRGRSTLIPELPAMSETVPEIEINSWNALFAPIGLDPIFLAALRSGLSEITKDVGFWQKIRLLGAESFDVSVQGIRPFITSEIEKYRKLR